MTYSANLDALASYDPDAYRERMEAARERDQDMEYALFGTVGGIVPVPTPDPVCVNPADMEVF